MIDFCEKYATKAERTGSRHIDNDAVANAIPVVAFLASNSESSAKEFPEQILRGLIESVIVSPDVVIRALF